MSARLTTAERNACRARILDVIGDALGVKLAIELGDLAPSAAAAALWQLAETVVLIADDLEACP
ncbi:hypothetical protein [Georgenia wangjunii]|uniref:hypothetical protein n=1 Tax=Georgenia wangjunii TaxID=3117730 RepID=UPI002F25F5DB